MLKYDCNICNQHHTGHIPIFFLDYNIHLYYTSQLIWLRWGLLLCLMCLNAWFDPSEEMVKVYPNTIEWKLPLLPNLIYKRTLQSWHLVICLNMIVIFVTFNINRTYSYIFLEYNIHLYYTSQLIWLKWGLLLCLMCLNAWLDPSEEMVKVYPNTIEWKLPL